MAPCPRAPKSGRRMQSGHACHQSVHPTPLVYWAPVSTRARKPVARRHHYNEVDQGGGEIAHSFFGSNQVLSEDQLFFSEFLQKYSSLNRAVRVVAWMLRPIQTRRHAKPYHQERVLVTEEVQRATRLCIQSVQCAEFVIKVACIKAG